jgi:hypothetical protein
MIDSTQILHYVSSLPHYFSLSVLEKFLISHITFPCIPEQFVVLSMSCEFQFVTNLMKKRYKA